MAKLIKVGDRVKVGPKSRLHILSRIDPLMVTMCGQPGTVSLQLPAEMGFKAKMYVVTFDDPEVAPDADPEHKGKLAFFSRELVKI